jgi:hypothetical protein
MIDNISIRVTPQNNDVMLASLEDLRRSDTHTFQGHIKNMGIYQNLNGINIQGSLAKFLNGENVQALTRRQIESAVRKLETKTGLDLSESVVKSLEFGICVFTKEKPFNYMRLFGIPPIYTRIEFSKTTGVETITMKTRTGSYAFTVYDKLLEMERGRNKDMFPKFIGRNVLRLEYKITKRRGIKSTFGGDLTVYDLYKPDVYEKLRSLFLEMYAAIPKVGGRISLLNAVNVTPMKLMVLQADHFRHSYPKDYMFLLQTLRENGAFKSKSLERIRAGERKRDRDYTLIDSSPLITELDALVLKTIMMNCN